MKMEMLVKWSPNETIPSIPNLESSYCCWKQIGQQCFSESVGRAGGAGGVLTAAVRPLSLLSYSLRVGKMAEC